MIRSRLLLAFSLIVASHAGSLQQAIGQSDWPTWRGPNGNGTASPGSYPTSWSEDQNVRWKIDLPGPGSSTPIVLGDLIYVTLAKDNQNTLFAIRPDGTIAWERTFGAERPGKHTKATGCNSSPVTDGKNVYVYFKSGDLACVSSSGETLWSINLQKEYAEDSLWWDLGTSPVLTDKAIVIAVMQTGPSFLLALDKTTGKELWKTDRWLDVREEANQSYTTPTLGNTKQGSVLFTMGADHLTATRASDGKALWKVGGFNPGNDPYFRSIASPIVVGDLVICPYARGNTVTAIKTELELDEKSRVAWQIDFGSDVPTPTTQDGKIYLLRDGGLVYCLKSANGDVLWKEQLPKSRKPFSSSPILADGKIYCVREDATTFVLQDGETPKLIATNSLEGFAVATPVFSKNRIYLRTLEALYCIENR